MNKISNGIKYSVIAVALLWAMVVLFPVNAHAEHSKLIQGSDLTHDVEEENWSYKDNKLELNEGSFILEGDFDCQVENHADTYIRETTTFTGKFYNDKNVTIYGFCCFNGTLTTEGTITVDGGSCSFASDTINEGTIEGGGFLSTVTNRGTVKCANYMESAVVTNEETGTITGLSVMWATFTNYGTAQNLIISSNESKVENYGTMEDCECRSVITNQYGGTLKNNEFNEYATLINKGNMENNTTKCTVTNEKTGNILSGTFEQIVTNYGTLTNGTFAKVENYASINNGTYPDAVNNYENAKITNGTFTGTVTNQAGAAIKGGTFQEVNENGSYSGKVDNYGTIESGEFHCTVSVWKSDPGAVITWGDFYGNVNNMGGTIQDGNYYQYVSNDGVIQNGTFACEMENYGTISGGDFYQPVANSGTIDAMNGVEKKYDTATKLNHYTVYGSATLGIDLTLKQGETLTIPDGTTLIIPNGVTLNTANGSVDQKGELVVKTGGTVVTAKSEQQGKAWIDVLEQYKAGAVTSEDREKIEAAVEKVQQLLASNTLSKETQTKLEKANKAVKKLLTRLDEAENAKNTDSIQKAENITADTVTKKDKKTLKAAKKELEQALETYGDNYTDEEKDSMQAALERINDALEVIETEENEESDTKQTARSSDVKTLSKTNNPQTGDESHLTLWAVAFVASAVVITLLVVVTWKKRAKTEG